MMASARSWAVDTSVAIAALDAGHAAHAQCRAAVQRYRPALAGHAASEVFAVLTRLPGHLAVDPTDAARLIDRVFPEVAWLSESASTALRSRLATTGIVGGAVYDALVGEASRTNARRLLTRDLRARRTYDLLGVDYLLVS
ncbi:MAG: type II toxin-antitoxin system VapC family toxin [Dermatophilaceae bacterium]